MKKRTKDILIMIVCMLTIGAILAIIIPNSIILQGDTFWHIKNGEWIINNHSIPNKDHFSYHKDLNFISHEWLFDLLIYFISKGGTLAVNMYAILTVGFSYAYVIFRSKDSNKWLFRAGTLFVLTLVGFYKGIMAIPDTIGAIVLVAMAVNIIENRTFRVKLIVNSILSAFLVNFQGGMMSAGIVQTVFLMGLPVATNWLTRKPMKEEVKKCVCMVGTALISSLLNPYGIKVFKYGFMMSTDASKFIFDWQPYSFKTTASILIVLILVGLALYGSYLHHSKVTLDLRIATLFYYFVILFNYQRAVNIFSFGLMIIVGDYIYMAIKDLLDKCQRKCCKIVTYGIEVTLGALVVVCMVGGIRGISIPNQTLTEYLTENYISADTQEYIRDKRVFNIVDYGGHLEYLNIPAFIDGRVDVYTPEYGNPDIFTDCIKALHSDELMVEISKKYNFTVLVLESNTTVAQIFVTSPNWKVIEYNQNTIILERNLY